MAEAENVNVEETAAEAPAPKPKGKLLIKACYWLSALGPAVWLAAFLAYISVFRTGAAPETFEMVFWLSFKAMYVMPVFFLMSVVVGRGAVFGNWRYWSAGALFVVAYIVLGGLLYFDPGQQFRWLLIE